jgi:hypothetical protein
MVSERDKGGRLAGFGGWRKRGGDLGFLGIKKFDFRFIYYFLGE